MKKRNIIITITIIFIIVALIIIGNFNKNNNDENKNTKIVTSFYPIYIMTLNITNGIDGIEVSNMAETYTGCIHDYTLTTSDLKKFEKADIFIENGQGMENFSKKIIDSYPNVKIIDSSKEISDVILEHNEEVNAHFWTSIDNYILQVKEITNRLKELDEIHRSEYERNSIKYISKLEELKSEYESNLNNLKGKKAVSLNESFSYLLKYIGMDEILISTDHEQSSLSAETAKDIINKMKEEAIDIIIIEENDDDKNANTIKSETGAKVYKLKDAMSGEDSLDSYINIMKNNLEVLAKM